VNGAERKAKVFMTMIHSVHLRSLFGNGQLT
jgi:hypothetical protein